MFGLFCEAVRDAGIVKALIKAMSQWAHDCELLDKAALSLNPTLQYTQMQRYSANS